MSTVLKKEQAKQTQYLLYHIFWNVTVLTIVVQVTSCAGELSCLPEQAGRTRARLQRQISRHSKKPKS